MEPYNKQKKITLISILSIFGIFLMNQIIFLLQRFKDTFSPKNSHEYSWRFGNIFYTKQGKGTPILLIHTLDSGSSSLEFCQLVKPLSKKHTVYVLDLLGCGRSEKPKISYTGYMYVQLINDFIKDIIGQKTDVIVSGNSCSFAIQACSMEKEQFHKLLLINPQNMASASWFPTKCRNLLKYLLESPIIGTSIYNIMHSTPMIHHRFFKKYFQNPSDVQKSYMEEYYKNAHRGGTRAKYLYACQSGGYMNSSLVYALQNIDQSIYLAISQNIPDAQNTLEQYQVLNPSIEGCYLKHTLYLPHLENPQSLLDLCKIFF